MKHKQVRERNLKPDGRRIFRLLGIRSERNTTQFSTDWKRLPEKLRPDLWRSTRSPRMNLQACLTTEPESRVQGVWGLGKQSVAQASAEEKGRAMRTLAGSEDA